MFFSAYITTRMSFLVPKKRISKHVYESNMSKRTWPWMSLYGGDVNHKKSSFWKQSAKGYFESLYRNCFFIEPDTIHHSYHKDISFNVLESVSRRPQYKDVYRRTKEMWQCSRTFKANCCLKVHNRVFRKYTKFAILALLPTLYSYISYSFFICKTWCQ